MPGKPHRAIHHRKCIAFNSVRCPRRPEYCCFSLKHLHLRVLLLQKVGNRVKGWKSG